MAFYIGFYAYAIIVHNLDDQPLPQLFMEQLYTLRYNVDTLNICMKDFWFVIPSTNFVCGGLTVFTLSVRASVCSKWLFYIGFKAYAIIVHNWADQLLPQLFMEQFDTLRYNVDTLNICMKDFWFVIPPQTLFVVG